MEQHNLPIVLDIEASGFGSGSYPIEVGLITGEGLAYCTLIKPESEWQHWDKQAEALHRIRRQQLLDIGKDIKMVATELNELLGGKTVYSDAWGNDMSWLALLFECAMVPQRFRLESINVLLREEQKVLWDRTKQQVVTEMELSRHRASSDAKIIQQTYIQTLQAL